MLKGINNFTFVNKILPKRQFKKRQRGFSMHPKRQHILLNKLYLQILYPQYYTNLHYEIQLTSRKLGYMQCKAYLKMVSFHFITITSKHVFQTKSAVGETYFEKRSCLSYGHVFKFLMVLPFCSILLFYFDSYGSIAVANIFFTVNKFHEMSMLKR